MRTPPLRADLALSVRTLFAVTAMATSALAEAPALEVIGREGQSVSLTVEDLKSLPRTELTVAEKNREQVKYSGIPMSHVLTKVGAAQGEQLRGEWMRCVVLVEATDGYRAAYALPEFDATFNDREIVLADSLNGAPLPEGQGPFRIVVPDEMPHSRWIRMVKRIRIIDLGALELPPATTTVPDAS